MSSVDGDILASLGDIPANADIGAFATATAAAEGDLAQEQITGAQIGFGPDGQTAGVLIIGWSLAPIIHDLRETSLLLAVMGLSISLAGVALLLIFNRRMVGEPLSGLVGIVGKVAQGELDIQVPMIRRRDEVGRLAISIDKLRCDLIAANDQRAAIQAKRDAQEQAHVKKLAGLNATLGSIVSAARAGDFDQIVHPLPDDPVLAELANGVNELCKLMARFLRETEAMATALDAGHLGHQMPEDFSGRLLEVAEKLNHTGCSIGSLVGELAESEAQLASVVEQISDNSRELLKRSKSQAEYLEQTTATMEELSVSTKANAKNVRDSAKRATETRDQANKGREVLGNAISAMSEIEAQAAQISEITTVIDSIAFQTNLLALNAAVEAARAGDAGKGFAVVAAEVRTLAQRSADAARDITGLIETSEARVKSGTSLVGQSGEMLDGIIDSISGVTETLQDISNATEEQSLGIAEIAGVVSQLDEMTHASADLSRHGRTQAVAVEKQTRQLSAQLAHFRSDDNATRIAAE